MRVVVLVTFLAFWLTSILLSLAVLSTLTLLDDSGSVNFCLLSAPLIFIHDLSSGAEISKVHPTMQQMRKTDGTLIKSSLVPLKDNVNVPAIG